MRALSVTAAPVSVKPGPASRFRSSGSGSEVPLIALAVSYTRRRTSPCADCTCITSRLAFTSSR